jgi:hypothetical protein
MGRGFKAHPSSIHDHANRTSQRADQISQTGSSASGAGLQGESLGAVGSSAASGHQQLTSRVQGAIGQAGSRLQNQSDLLHRTGNNISTTDDDHAGRIRGINGPTSNVRNPHAESGPSRSRAGGGPARRPAAPPQVSNSGNSNIPPEAHQMAQWIKDHRQNGSIITHTVPPNGKPGQVDVGEKVHPVVWNGTQYDPNQRVNPNNNTYGGRVYGNQTNNPNDKLPEIGNGNWDNGGYFKVSPGAAGTTNRPGQYYEFDVHQSPQWSGQDKPNRTPEGGGQGGRIVAGDDGSMYYSNHYQNPQQIQGPTIQHPPR